MNICMNVLTKILFYAQQIRTFTLSHRLHLKVQIQLIGKRILKTKGKT